MCMRDLRIRQFKAQRARIPRKFNENITCIHWHGMAWQVSVQTTTAAHINESTLAHRHTHTPSLKYHNSNDNNNKYTTYTTTTNSNSSSKSARRKIIFWQRAIFQWHTWLSFSYEDSCHRIDVQLQVKRANERIDFVTCLALYHIVQLRRRKERTLTHTAIVNSRVTICCFTFYLSVSLGLSHRILKFFSHSDCEEYHWIIPPPKTSTHTKARIEHVIRINNRNRVCIVNLTK